MSSRNGPAGLDGAGRRGDLRVLVYHRIGDPAHIRGDPHLLSATPEALDTQLSYLADRYTPVAAGEVAAALRGEADLPRRAVLVTFDDAYRDFLTQAWPVLRRHAVPAVLFVPTAFPGTAQRFWWDHLYEALVQTDVLAVEDTDRRMLPLRTRAERHDAARRLIRALRRLGPGALEASLTQLVQELGGQVEGAPSVLTWEELRMLVSEGLAVGSHTRTHPALLSLAPDDLARELRGAHADLRREVGQVAPLFAYPYGVPDARARPILRDLGYAGAFVSLYGRNRMGEQDPFLLYRQSVDLGQSPVRFTLSLTAPYLDARESGRAVRMRLRSGWAWLTTSR